MVRGKNPAADMKRTYVKTFEKSLLISLVLHIIIFLSWQEAKVKPMERVRTQAIIKIEDIPETRQEIKRAPPPSRPSVPVEVESEDMPDDVTIESTELDVREENIPPPPPPVQVEAPPEDEEIVEFWHVEKQPALVKVVEPLFPEIARKAGIEGKVFLHLLVGKDGRVEQVKFIKGPPVFRDAAMTAAKQYLFTPAMQNDRPVKVWMALPIDFRFTE